MRSSLLSDIRADILRLQRFDKRVLARLIWDSPGLKVVIIYRLGHWLFSIGKNPLWWPLLLILKPVYWVFVAYMRFSSDIFISSSAEVGPGLYIGHFGGIRLSNCRLGAHCSIHQAVRLEPMPGSNNGPIIGDKVWIGAHAWIQGHFQIGDGATVGAGAQVTQDIAAGCLVLGNPARVMQRDYDNSSFL